MMSAEGRLDEIFCGTSCFCPCLIIGQMKTKIAREVLSLSVLSIGWQGFTYCLCTSALALFLWPFSPCLSFYLCRERKKLSVVYSKEPRLKKLSMLAQLYYFCLWPLNLNEQRIFIELMESENKLAYEWDLNSYKDYLRIASSPKITTIKVFIFGLHTSASDLFFKKFLRYLEPSDASPIMQNNSIGPTTTTISAGGDDISIGIRSYQMNNHEVKFFEVWNIPMIALDSYSLRCNLKTLDVALFIYDGESSGTSTSTIDDSSNSFSTMIAAHEKLTDSFNDNHLDPVTRKICVGLVNSSAVDDHLDNMDLDEQNYTDNNNNSPHHHNHHHHRHSLFQKIRRQSNRFGPRANLGKVEHWAKEVAQCDFVTVSATQNKGFRELYEIIAKAE